MATTFNELTTNRNGKAGRPGNKAGFTFKDRVDGPPLSDIGDSYDISTLPINVHDDWVEITAFNHYGHDIHVSTEPGEKDPDKFQVWGDPIAVEFWREDGQVFSDKWLTDAAARAYDEELAKRAMRLLRLNPKLSDSIAAEIENIKSRSHGANGLTRPESWVPGWQLTAAATRIGDRLECGEHLRNPDSTNARCDWAEVGEDGIAYGYNLSAKFIGEITVGEQLEGEKDDEYAGRVWDTEKVTSQQLEEFFAKEYGVQVNDAGDYGDFDLEFYVEYGPEGAAGTSIEAMGDRVESETKLLAARNDWEYGGAMQSKFAAFIGYHSESVLDDAGDYTGSRWVKDEA
jgi:hypothetical protein